MNARSKQVFDKLDALAIICETASETTQRAVRLEYLSIVAEYLYAEGASIQTLCPLLDLHADLEVLYDNQPGRRYDNERRRTAAGFNPEIMARAAAALDILAASGLGLDRASQIVSRQMMAQKFALPDSGGDVRGWRRVQIWYQRMLAAGASHPQVHMFEEFRNELIAAHGGDVVAALLAQPLWDRRHVLAMAS
jgi:hypothetical protein